MRNLAFWRTKLNDNNYAVAKANFVFDDISAINGGVNGGAAFITPVFKPGLWK
jgi:hypothetical protein